MARYRKKLRRYKGGGKYAMPPQYIGGGKLGQLIGTGVGAVGGSFVGQPMLGAKLGGMAGGAIGGAIEGEEEVEPQLNRSYASYGYRYGGDTDPKRVRSDTTRTRRVTDGRKPVRSIRGKQEANYKNNQALKQRLEKMRAGDYSMVGTSVRPDTVQTKQTQYANGGQIPGVRPLPQGAKKFSGPKHEQGGVPVNNQGNPTSPDRATAEVEGGETEQDGYIFSDTLTVPKTDGKTFAEVHEMMLQRGASKQDIQKLQMLQEQVQQKEGVAGGDDQPQMRDGGRHYQNGGWSNGNPEDWEEGEGAVETDTTGVLQNNTESFANEGLTREGLAEAAGYAIPALTKGVTALTSKGVEDTPRVKPTRVPVQSRAFNQGRRDLATSYRGMVGDPNASPNQKLAAQAQYIEGRSNLAGKEADYRTRQQQFNAQQQSRADRINTQSFQQDREVKAQESAAKKQMLMDAVTSPVNQFRMDEAGERSQIANILVSANQIQNPTDRKNAIRRGLKAIGLDDARIQEIIAKNNTQ